MSNATYSSQVFKPAATPVVGALLRELFSKTPLYIFITALKAVRQQPTKR
jgi:hypothetical protein